MAHKACTSMEEPIPPDNHLRRARDIAKMARDARNAGTSPDQSAWGGSPLVELSYCQLTVNDADYFVHKIIEAGCDVDYYDGKDHGPLAAAIELDNVPVARALFERGAKIVLKNPENYTMTRDWEPPQTPLDLAIITMSPGIVKWSLDSQPWKLSDLDEAMQVLVYQLDAKSKAREKMREIVDILRQKGANFDVAMWHHNHHAYRTLMFFGTPDSLVSYIRRTQHNTPVYDLGFALLRMTTQDAFVTAREEMIDAFFAIPLTHPNFVLQDSDMTQQLMDAIRQNNAHTVRILLAHGAKVEEATSPHWKKITIAREIANLLVDFEADVDGCFYTDAIYTDIAVFCELFEHLKDRAIVVQKLTSNLQVDVHILMHLVAIEFNIPEITKNVFQTGDRRENMVNDLVLMLIDKGADFSHVRTRSVFGFTPRVIRALLDRNCTAALLPSAVFSEDPRVVQEVMHRQPYSRATYHAALELAFRARDRLSMLHALLQVGGWVANPHLAARIIKMMPLEWEPLLLQGVTFPDTYRQRTRELLRAHGARDFSRKIDPLDLSYLGKTREERNEWDEVESVAAERGLTRVASLLVRSRSRGTEIAHPTTMYGVPAAGRDYPSDEPALESLDAIPGHRRVLSEDLNSMLKRASQRPEHARLQQMLIFHGAEVPKQDPRGQVRVTTLTTQRAGPLPHSLSAGLIFLLCFFAKLRPFLPPELVHMILGYLSYSDVVFLGSEYSSRDLPPTSPPPA